MKCSPILNLKFHNVAIILCNIIMIPCVESRVPPLLLCAAPSGPPREFRVVNTTALTVTISWLAPELIDQNGEITHYIINYSASGSSDQTEEFIMSVPGSSHPANFTFDHMLQGLQGGTQYTLQVAAATSVGTGPSSVLSFRTSTAAGWACLHSLSAIQIYLLNVF